MDGKFTKAFQLRLASWPYKIDYVEAMLRRMAKAGYDAVLIEYENNFPYSDALDLRSEEAYSKADVERIERVAAELGLDVIPAGVPFSHSGYIVSREAYKDISAGGDLDLSNPKSLELLVSAAEEFLAVHPRAKVIHFGGDEMGGLAKSPSAMRGIFAAGGRSEFYVEFVNKLAAALKPKGVRVAVWSDMLIRYPQAAEKLDRSVVIFYWDYWSCGETQPFLSIGGGCSEIAVLDRPALPGSLRKLFAWCITFPYDEIPVGHVQRYSRYWGLDAERKRAKSFPYFKFFKELGFTVIGACLTYPEKGSYLPNLKEKFEHVRWFSKRAAEAGGDGMVACLWQPVWAPYEAMLPGFMAALEFMERPEASDEEAVKAAASRMGGVWTEAATEAYLNAGEHFEFGDLMNPWWSSTPLASRFEWLEKAGMREEDLALAAKCRAKTRKLLSGVWRDLPQESYERFVVEDMLMRAEAELAVEAGDSAEKTRLSSECVRLRKAFLSHMAKWLPEKHCEEAAKPRYDELLACLKG